MLASVSNVMFRWSIYTLSESNDLLKSRVIMVSLSTIQEPNTFLAYFWNSLVVHFLQFVDSLSVVNKVEVVFHEASDGS